MSDNQPRDSRSQMERDSDALDLLRATPVPLLPHEDQDS